MKAHRKSPARSLAAGFTLIELLIVIVIIAILASVAFPVTAMVMERAKKAGAQNEVRQLANAIANYKMDYGKYPLPKGSGGQDQQFVTDSASIMSLLAGENVGGLNPKEKVFYEGKPAEEAEGQPPKNGMYGPRNEMKMADPWGNPYYIKIDGNYDGKLEGCPRMDGEVLHKPVAVWSKGKPEDSDDPFSTSEDESEWIMNY